MTTVTDFKKAKVIVYTEALERMHALARKEGWPIETEPDLPKWTIGPLTDESILIPEAVKRMNLVKEHVPNKGFLIAHEPGEKKKKQKKPELVADPIDWASVKTAMIGGLKVLGAVAVFMGLALAYLAVTAASVVAIDPALIALVDNGDSTVTRVLIIRWAEEDEDE